MQEIVIGQRVGRLPHIDFTGKQSLFSVADVVIVRAGGGYVHG